MSRKTKVDNCKDDNAKDKTIMDLRSKLKRKSQRIIDFKKKNKVYKKNEKSIVHEFKLEEYRNNLLVEELNK